MDEEEHHQVLCSPIQKALGERSLQFVFFVPTNKSTAINPQLDIDIYFQRKKILALATAGAHPLIEKTIRPQSGGGRAAKEPECNLEVLQITLLLGNIPFLLKMVVKSVRYYYSRL